MNKRRPVPSEVYDTEYFLSACGGYEEYAHSGGSVLPERLCTALSLAGDVGGLRVLDLGCGRGEAVRFCIDRGAEAVGVDYSKSALDLAQETLHSKEDLLVRAKVQELPFTEESFDLILAFDIVEHLHQPELQWMFEEAYRLLARGGRLLIHTMPNIWYYRFGYPLFRFVQRLRGRQLPRDPRERSRYVKIAHVNEQSVVSLRHSLRRAGFEPHVHLQNAQDYGDENSWPLRTAMRFVSTVYPFAWIFCNDIFATASKRE
jgi:ubiquinone/menaquinone biosynthesis C-methylase UbiE